MRKKTRLAVKVTPDVFYQYDKDHHITELKKGTTHWQYQYNERGQLTEEKLHLKPDEFSIGYQYDPEGNPESLTYPTGITIHYQPDAFGRPTQVGDSIRNFGYFPNGQLKTFYNMNDILTLYTQNKRGWPETIMTEKDGKPLVTQNYQYDTEGNLTQAQIQNHSQTFSYDGLNQLIEAKGPWGEANFAYDITGNILQKTIGKDQLTYTYAPDQNRLTKITGSQNKELIYDDRGNLSVKGKELFSFDEARNLTALLGTNTKTLYRYDGNHHRTMIQQGETVTYTIHNRAGQLLAEYTPSHSKTYLYHRNQLMARIDKTGNQESIHYYHTDLLGSPIAQSNQQSQLDWQETYAPYGKRLLQQSQDNQQWYTGKTEDPQTGFIYLNARYYDPEIARFISPDPVYFKEQNPMSFNRYAYVSNNPMRWVDPKGLTKLSINIRQGIMVVDPEQFNRKPYTMSMTSGRENCMNNPSCMDQKNIGPIPRGNYIMKNDELSNPPLYKDILRNMPGLGGDWGDWRVPIHPAFGTRTFGRSGFFLHGGALKGSTGCIDIGGGVFGNESTDQLLRDILNDPDSNIPTIIK